MSENNYKVSKFLLQLVEDDEKVLDNLGVTFHQLSELFDKIKRFTEDKMKKYGVKFIIFDEIEAVYHNYKGLYYCDYKHIEYCTDNDWIFTKNNEVLSINSFLMHQIVEHHFFQSKNHKRRIEPKDLVAFFNLQSKKDK